MPCPAQRVASAPDRLWAWEPVDGVGAVVPVWDDGPHGQDVVRKSRPTKKKVFGSILGTRASAIGVWTFFFLVREINSSLEELM